MHYIHWQDKLWTSDVRQVWKICSYYFIDHDWTIRYGEFDVSVWLPISHPWGIIQNQKWSALPYYMHNTLWRAVPRCFTYICIMHILWRKSMQVPGNMHVITYKFKLSGRGVTYQQLLKSWTITLPSLFPHVNYSNWCENTNSNDNSKHRVTYVHGQQGYYDAPSTAHNFFSAVCNLPHFKTTTPLPFTNWL